MKAACRRAMEKDLPLVVALQDVNLASNLSSEAKRDGFLSGAFTEEQFAAMNEDVGVLVCYCEEHLAGFICVGSIDFNRPFALPGAMIKALSTLLYQGKSVTSYQCVIAGPVCVASAHRGAGLFGLMYDELHQILPKEVELITTLVSRANPRSIRAHEKVGMVTVGGFQFRDDDFVIMVREPRPAI